MDWLFSTPSDGVSEARELEDKRQDLAKEVEDLGEAVRTQIEHIIDMCEDCVDEARGALQASELPGEGTDTKEDGEDQDGNAVTLSWSLDMDFSEVGDEGSSQREDFKKSVVADIATALGLPESKHKCIQIREMQAGSVNMTLEILPDQPSGLKWQDVGSERPTKGRELAQAGLAAILERRPELDAAEWKDFNISDLRHDDFVKAGRSYFTPRLESAGDKDATTLPTPAKLADRLRKQAADPFSLLRSGKCTMHTKKIDNETYFEQLEERKVGEEVKKVWSLITFAEDRYREKVEADEALARAMDELQAFTEPSHILFCSMAVPEMSRKLEKIYGAGLSLGEKRGNKMFGGYHGVAGSEDTRAGIFGVDTPGAARNKLSHMQKLGHGSWATPLNLLQEDAAAPENAAEKLEQFRKELKEVIDELQDGKYRSLAKNDKDSEGKSESPAQPALFRKLLENDGADAQTLIDKLSTLAESPEAAGPAAESLKVVADTIKESLAVFKKLSDKEAELPGKTAEEHKKLLDERQAIIDEIQAVFNKDEKGGDDKKDDKKDEKKDGDENKQGTGRTGPLYDPEDEMGAVLMGEKLEGKFLHARQLLQAMMLRQQEVENTR